MGLSFCAKVVGVTSCADFLIVLNIVHCSAAAPLTNGVSMEWSSHEPFKNFFTLLTEKLRY